MNETYIQIGADNGLPTVLVMSGVTDEAALQKSAIRPTLTLPAMGDLIAYL